jgi:glycine reductase complex component B subunit gamma
VLEREIERAGIPAVLITTLVPTAQMLQANRIVAGVGITNPMGDPRLSHEEEKVLRRNIMMKALETLTRETS